MNTLFIVGNYIYLQEREEIVTGVKELQEVITAVKTETKEPSPPARKHAPSKVMASLMVRETRRWRVQPPPRLAIFFCGDLIMKYFLRSFSPFH